MKNKKRILAFWLAFSMAFSLGGCGVENSENEKSKHWEKLKAENAIRKKNLFLSNMSHEVRTPLNAIVGFSTLMASEEMEVDEVSRKEFCEIIKVNSYQLLKLINHIIDFSDFDGDNISMNTVSYTHLTLPTT